MTKLTGWVCWLGGNSPAGELHQPCSPLLPKVRAECGAEVDDATYLSNPRRDFVAKLLALPKCPHCFPEKTL